MKLFFLVFTLFFNVSYKLVAQVNRIVYSYKTNEFSKDSFDISFRSPNPYIIDKRSNELNPLSIEYSHNLGYSKTSINLAIKDTILLLFADGNGHLIALLPESDTIFISADSVFESLPYFGEDSLLIPWQKFNSYKSKKKNLYQFYDSLEMNTGSPLYHKISHKLISKISSDSFFILCTKLYNKRINYTDEYFARNGLLDDVKSLFIQEIKSGYLLNLLQVFQYGHPNLPIASWLPKAYIDVFNNYDYNNPRFLRKTTMYLKAISTLSYYFFTYSTNGATPTLKTEYDTTKAKFSGIVRDWLLKSFFEFNVKSKDREYDSLLLDFKKITLDTLQYKNIDSTRKIYSQPRNILFKEILLTKIVDVGNNQITIKDLLKNGKPIFIDNWASWCLPCISQMKFSVKLEKKYGDKINFVYLSMDKNNLQWKAKSKELHLLNSYLVEKNFDSKYADFFNITSIPRYIIIDKDGKLITADSPFPSEGKLLEGVLRKILKK